MPQSKQASAPAGMEIVSKSGAVLQALSRDGELSAAEIAETIGEPASSVYRLLSSLETLGWVERSSRHGKVRVGLEFVRLGHRLEEQLDVRRLALPELRSLNAQTKQTAFLCIRRDDRAVCVERIDGADVQIQRLRLGESLPLGEGAAPRAILAFETPSLVSEYLARQPAERRAALRAELEEIRRSGSSLAHEDGITGIGSVGAPIFDQKGLVVGGLSISGLRQNVFDARFDAAGLVKTAADRVSESLGARLETLT